MDYLATRGVIGKVAGHWRLHARIEEVANAVPESLRQLIEKQLDRLSAGEQRLLEAASVVGGEFSAVAAGVEETVEQVEAKCEGLVHWGQFLQAQGTATLPDGTVTGRYGFLHALYQKVLYARLAATRRMRLHRQIGARGEVIYGKHAGDIAVELAVRFERGRDYHQAVHYLRQAAQQAMLWSAHREAIAHLTKGLECLQVLPATPERSQQELTLQALLGSALVATRGYTAPEVVQTYTRARELCQQSRETPQLFPVLAGLWKFYFVRAELQPARELAEQFLSLAQNRSDLDLLLPAHLMQGLVLFELGELPIAHAHLEQSINVHDPQKYRPDRFSAVLYGEDPLVIGLSYEALALWYLGYPAQAQKSIHAALTLAHELAYPFSLAFALHFAALVHRFRGEGWAVQERAEAVMALSHEQGFPFWLADGAILWGWALTEQAGLSGKRGQGEEGVAQLHQGLAAYRTTGAKLAWPYFLALLTEAYAKVGQVEEGLSALAEALGTVQQTGERMYEAELYRLKGTLALRSQASPRQVKTRQDKSTVNIPQSAFRNPKLEEAEAYFHKAIKIARRQQAKSLELRAVMNLSRLWQQQGKKAEARQMLAKTYDWFTEGFDTKDLQEAKALLEELTWRDNRCL
ncbi:MAG TPA: hypothetical protein VGX03_22790 [Candidatus Binatia bacterium]|nr:hypothetical protein [Candidatus Binatia bacterium]